MVLMNYFALMPGMPARLHFTDWYFTVREVADRESGKTKPLKTVVFWIDEINGEPAARTFSIAAKKLLSPLLPFMTNKDFVNYDFVITEMGSGFYKDWNIQPISRPVQIPLSERQQSFDVKALLEKLWDSI